MVKNTESIRLTIGIKITEFHPMINILLTLIESPIIRVFWSISLFIILKQTVMRIAKIKDKIIVAIHSNNKCTVKILVICIFVARIA